mgnify:CR=1 FL=1
MTQVTAPERPPVHPVDEVLPPAKLFTLGLQHLFIMYAGAVAVPLIVGEALNLPAADIAMLVNADLLVCGIITILQTTGLSKWLGVRLPLASGATFTVLTPMIIIGSKQGLPTVYGAFLVAGAIGIIVAGFFSKMIRFFPPLVTGVVISVIGLSLIGASIELIAGKVNLTNPDGTLKPNPDFAPIPNVLLAGLVILLIVVFTRFLKGFWSQIAVLLAMVVGTIVAIPMNLVNMSRVGDAGWFGVSRPFHFGTPVFELSSIIAMTLVLLVTFTESTADMLAVGEIVGRHPTEQRIAAGLRLDAVSQVMAGFMNSFPDTAFAENVGLVQMTGVRSRWVVTVTGSLLLIMGLIPKFGEIIAAIPGPVVGGAATVMFAMVTSVGINTLRKVRFDGKYAHNMLIVAVALSCALIPAYQPKFFQQFPDWFQVILTSPITSAVIVVFVLNILFNHLLAPPTEEAPQGVREIPDSLAGMN